MKERFLYPKQLLLLAENTALEGEILV